MHSALSKQIVQESHARIAAGLLEASARADRIERLHEMLLSVPIVSAINAGLDSIERDTMEMAAALGVTPPTETPSATVGDADAIVSAGVGQVAEKIARIKATQALIAEAVESANPTSETVSLTDESENYS